MDGDVVVDGLSVEVFFGTSVEEIEEGEAVANDVRGVTDGEKVTEPGGTDFEFEIELVAESEGDGEAGRQVISPVAMSLPKIV